MVRPAKFSGLKIAPNGHIYGFALFCLTAQPHLLFKEGNLSKARHLQREQQRHGAAAGIAAEDGGSLKIVFH